MRLFFYLFIALNIFTFLQAQTAGGDVDITAGNGASTGGSVNITSGTAAEFGGSINIRTTTGNDVGDINITTAHSNGVAGNILISSGDSNGGLGGITLQTGNSSGSASDINLICGTTYEGSDINLTAGDGDNGGNINLAPGVGSLGSDGLVIVDGSGTYTGSWTSVSDKRYKDDIKNLEAALGDVVQLQGVTYKWKKDEYPDKNFTTGKQIGLIAQDVENIIPELVETNSEGYKSIDYSKISVLLIEAIKEQQKQIENLTWKIETLEKIINGEVVEVSSLNK